MESLIFEIIGSKYIKVAGYNGNELILSSKYYSDFKKLLAQKNKFKIIKIWRNIKVIPVSAIKSIVLYPENETLKIRYETNKKKSIFLNFGSENNLRIFSDDLIEKKRFKEFEEEENKKKVLLINLILYLLFSLMIIAVIVMSTEDGGNQGNHRVLTYIFYYISQFLGVTGTSIIGVSIMAFMGYNIHKRYKNPDILKVYK